MKECINCKAKNRSEDAYCRNCGCYIQSNKYYILINVMIIFLILGNIGLIVLFIASYIVIK